MKIEFALWEGVRILLNYAYGYCGMPCALCTRYRTNGKSRCPGCSHDGYYKESCKVYRCCKATKDKGLEYTRSPMQIFSHHAGLTEKEMIIPLIAVGKR